MKFDYTKNMTSLRALIAIAITAILVGLLPEKSEAQYFSKWLAIGSFQHLYNSGGARTENDYGNEGLEWPAINSHKGHYRSLGLVIMAQNWNPGTGDPYDVYSAHFGPRDVGEGEFFQGELSLITKHASPLVSVDGLSTFQKPIFIDTVRSQKPKFDGMMYNTANTVTGVSIERRMRAFNNEYHDNYHISEYTFTNTGDIDGDGETDIEQDLEGVLFTFFNRYTINYEAGYPSGVGWGRNSMNDVVNDGNKDYDVDFDNMAVYAWHGRFPSFTAWNNLGAPSIDARGGNIQSADTLGRLTASEFVGRIHLHADISASDENNAPHVGSTAPANSQPFGSNIIDSDDNLTTETDPDNVARNVSEYDFVSEGHVYPYHADNVMPPPAANGQGGVLDPVEWRNRFANQDRRPDYISAGGFQNVIVYGPYDIPFGEDVNIVFADAVNGLDEVANREIGLLYKRTGSIASGFNEDALLDYDNNKNGVIDAGESLTKNEWVMTGRDSLMKTFDRIIANYESGYDIPEAPWPPATFAVQGEANRISLSWTHPEDGGEGWENANSAPTRTAYEIYRAKGGIDSVFYKIAELDPDETSFADEDGSDYFSNDVGSPARGANYYYYIQAVGDVNNNSTGNTPTGVRLRSNRYYTQTYAPAVLKREPGPSITDARVVPNPLNFASNRSFRYTGPENRLGFLNIPGDCDIKIYTEAGELVQTLEHRDTSGDEYWNIATSSNQPVVSGIYFAVIIDNETGDKVIRKFTIIR